MSAISFYEENGFISSTLQGDEAVVQLNKDLSKIPWIDGLWDENIYYVNDNAAVFRPVCPALLDGLVLANLPVPCVIDINNTKYEFNESEVELDLGTGSFLIKVIAFPYLDGVFNVKN